MADIVGGIASVTQLAAYSQCVMGTLSRLYRAAQDGPASAKDHCQGISRLLKIVDRIGHRDGSDSELFVPLLVDIAQVAKTLTGYLDQRKQCHTIWVLLTNGGAIDDAFGALREKTSHLHLCLSQQNNKALGEIQQELVARRSIMSSNSSPDPPQVPPKDNTFGANTSKARSAKNSNAEVPKVNGPSGHLPTATSDRNAIWGNKGEVLSGCITGVPANASSTLNTIIGNEKGVRSGVTDTATSNQATADAATSNQATN